MTTYKTPILVSLLQITGALNAAVSGILGIMSFNEGQVPVGIGLLIAAVITLVVACGLAQCVDFLGRTAYNTGILVDRSTITAARTPVTMVDVAAMHEARRVSGRAPAAPGALTSDDPDIAAHLARKAQRGE